jgi:hypothetical protein
MIDWRAMSSGVRDIAVDGDSIVVTLPGQRQQRLDVEAGIDAMELRSIVARRAVVETLDDPVLAAWHRNRAMNLVGFRLDDRGRLIGETWIPRAGLTTAEFLVYVRGMAAACDLFEFQLTGKDRE